MLETKRKRPTLKTISDKCGLSVPTVSRALSDAPDIAQETKALVRRVAKEIRYVPNRAGLRLKTGKTHFVAFISDTDQIAQDHMGPVVASIISALAKTSYNLVVFPQMADDDPIETVRAIVEGGLADSLILNRTRPDDARVAYLLETNAGFVTYGRTQWAHAHAHYDFDNRQFGAMAVDRLLACGRKRLAMLRPSEAFTFGQDMIAGAKGQAAARNVSLQYIDGATSDAAPAEIVEQTRAHLRRYPETDGVICAAAIKTSAIAAALDEAGYTLGQDVDVCAKEVRPCFALEHRRVHFIYEDLSAAGHFLAKAAVHAIEAPGEAPLQKVDHPVFNRPTKT